MSLKNWKLERKENILIMVVRRKCNHCGMDYEYEQFVNLITFCPYCHQYDYLECEYGYGPVVPCRFYHGNEVIGMVTYYEEDSSIYQLTSQKYNLNEFLGYSYLEALYEARDRLAAYLL